MGFLNDNFIADFFYIVIQWLYKFINEYSLTIILVSLAVRLFLFPMDFKQRINSKKIAALNPQIEGMKKRYANTPDQLNVRINKLYKDNGISTFAGCLPMVFQIVFLFAFYGALRRIASKETISLILNGIEDGAENVKITRWLWVNNLWQPDSGFAKVLPTAKEFLAFIQNNINNISAQTLGILQKQNILVFADNVMSINEATYTTLTDAIISANGYEGINNGWFILPILSGGSMFLQQWLSSKLNPNPQMEQQMALMKYMYPIVSFIVCLSSNTMFAIYWTFTSIYGMVVDLIFNLYYKRKEQKELAN